jgi:hypothetical protein
MPIRPPRSPDSPPAAARSGEDRPPARLAPIARWRLGRIEWALIAVIVVAIAITLAMAIFNPS